MNGRNRLGESRSLYLQQHMHQAVHWWPWGAEAFAEAEARDVPVLVSVGYSSCHWCHVMSHESFDDAEIASELNQHFVSVKVDREEHPDVDERLMSVVQLTSGRGGWPMTVFLTPDRQPFFAGTYFPKQDRGQYPGLRTLLARITELWTTDRSPLLQSAQGLVEALAATANSAPLMLAEVTAADLAGAVLEHLEDTFDDQYGGFGGAPKFPPHAALEFLRRVQTGDSRDMRGITLRRMAHGGFHDHVGGGFHRYSTDGHWKLPHFEKMLYDNALLLPEYAHWDDPIAKVVVQKQLRFLREDLLEPSGTYASAFDADSFDPELGHSEEGAYYVWKQAELAEFGELAMAVQATQEGNFLDEATRQTTGRNVLHFGGSSPESFEAVFLELKARRDLRPKPARDGKCIAAWNGLLISAFAQAGQAELAVTALQAWKDAVARCGRLPRILYDGEPWGEAVLDDYAHMAFAAYAVEGESEFFHRLVGSILEHADPECGGFWTTVGQDSAWLAGAKSVFDHPIPSSNATAIRVLVRAGRFTEAAFHLARLAHWVLRAPGSCESLALAAMEFEALGGKWPADLEWERQGDQLVVNAGPGWKFNPEVPFPAEFSAIAVGQNGQQLRFEMRPVAIENGFTVAIPPQVQAVTVRYQLCDDSACLPWRKAQISVG